MKLLFLGTGTSTGVPQLRCHCRTCMSLDPCDKRLRASAIVEVEGRQLLIDCGPDLRTQLLRANSPWLNACLITHSHYDHVGGIDDLRPYCYPNPFAVYCKSDVADDLRARVPYCFYEKKYPGVPNLDLHIIDPYHPFDVSGIEVMPLPVMHYNLPILGYKIGDLAYITDCKTMPESTLDMIKGIDTLVLNALRPEPHLSHLSLQEALRLIDRIKPRQAYLTHMSHDMPPAADVHLPEHVHLAHDMMDIEI